jgi:hypothetical protein
MNPTLTQSHQLKTLALPEASVQYRLNQPMMVLAFKDNHQLAVTVPVGKIVDVSGPVEGDDRFLVKRERRAVPCLRSDLADRAERVLADAP